MAAGGKRGGGDGFTPAILDRIAQAMLDAYDAGHGGFGTGQKFPHPEALDFALLWAEKRGNPAFREIVLRSLVEMAQGALLDPVEGGFFRFCATRDWRQPCTEKLLVTQAGLLRNYLEAWQQFGRDELRKVAQKTLSYVDHVLRDPATGAWFAGQDADDGYYALPERLRADRKAPRVEATVAAQPLCAAISAFLKAGAVLGDEVATRHALGATRFLVGTLWSRGRGVYHSATPAGDKQILGLLGDQVFALRALLHVVQYTGDLDLLEVVEDLVSTLLQKESAQHGGFFDARDDAAHFAQARRRHETLQENGLAAEALLRAGWLLARPEWRGVAERALRLFAADHPLYAYHTAEYGRAVELFFHPPQCLFVVGGNSDPRTAGLLDVARRTWMPSKLVLALDPAKDFALLARHGLAAELAPLTHVRIGDQAVAVARDPAELRAAMAAAETLRDQSLK
ncbi:MAG: thioredoxin domain-containing protein [Planctomycetes bacterium]|nr:thioredoxin domain-containing protein [Planctomycetota bacterium]